MKVKSYRELKVWQLGMELTREVYLLVRELPEYELDGLSSQMRRAAVSIPANIAEGHARESTKESLRYISIARGSLAELETFLLLAENLESCEGGRTGRLLQERDEEGRMLRGLQKRLKAKCDS